jgi:mRNA interferase MazF
MTGLGHAQVWWADLDKARPVVVLTRARVAPLLRRVLVAPVTTVRGLATEVALGAAEGVREGSVTNLDNVQLLPVDALLRQAAEIEEGRWPEFCAAMANVMAC